MTKQKKIIVSVVAVSVVLIFVTLFFILRRGSNLTVQAPAPPREVTPVSLPPPVPSTIAVKADVPIQAITTLAESTLSTYLDKPIQWEKGAIDAAITLDPGDLTMTSTRDGTVSVSIPLRFGGWVRVSKTILGKALQKRENFEGQATGLLVLEPTLNPDWRITAKTASYIQIQKAEIKILGITVSIRGILTELVKGKVLPKLEAIIVKYIEDIDVKTRVDGLWTKLYEPIVLKETPAVVLGIEPLEIFAQKLSSDGKKLSISLGIKTHIQVNVGNTLTDATPPAGTRADVPNIRFVNTLESGYHIIAPIDVTYTAIENLAKPYVEKSHKLKGVDTRVENLTLYGSGAQLVAGIGFRMPSLGATGQLYLLGTPSYDATTTAVSVTEFDYTLTTQNLLLDIAQVAGEGFFPNLRTTVEEKLVFPLEDQLTALHKQLADVIAERSIGAYIRLHGTVDTITPETLHLTQAGVRVFFRLQGDLGCEINLNASKTSY